MSRFLSVAVCLLVLTLPVAAQQQDQSQSTPSDQQNSSSAPPGKKAQPQPASRKKPSGEQNPFPEAQSEAAAHDAQQQKNVAPSASAPSEPDAPKGKSSEADQNPFPEEQSQKATRQSQEQGSGSGQDYSSSQTGLQGLDIPKSVGKARVTEDPSLGKKDIEVGTFYLKTGDYKGAYDRFREATQLDPTNSDAVFGLAETARHLNLRDEAIRNYRLYLSALPDGPRAKEARKGLKDLGHGQIPD